MFYADMAIDAFQNAKKSWLNSVVSNDAVKTPLSAFVDAQTVFTKQVVKSTTDASNAIAKNLFDMMGGK